MTHLADEHGAGMHSGADPELRHDNARARPDPRRWVHDLQTGCQGPGCAVGMCVRKAEVDQHAVTHVASDVPTTPGDRFGAALLERSHHIAHVLRVESIGQHRGIGELRDVRDPGQ